MADKKPGVMIYFELRPCLRRLTNEQKGILFEALLEYGETGAMPEFDDLAVAVAMDFVKPRIDRDAAVYAAKQEAAKVANEKRWGVRDESGEHSDTVGDGRTQSESDRVANVPPSSTASSSSTSSASSTASKECEPPAAAPLAPDKPKARRFIPPTVEEVAEYVQSRSSPVDPQGFIDYYESKGWTVGKSPMADWKAACRAAETWERWQTNGNATPTTQARATVKSFTDIAAELEAELKAQAP